MMVGLGDPGCGKSKAEAVALVIAGPSPALQISKFTDKVNKHLSAASTIGIHLDDATNPREFAASAKRYLDCCMSAEDNHFVSLQCCPLYTLNYHVL